jgi:hypothetical protein
MLVILVATICLHGAACEERVIDPHATLAQCQMAIRKIPQWMAENGYDPEKGYTLESWGCTIGSRRKTPI